MQIFVNDEPREVADGTTVAVLLQQLDVNTTHVAVERNEELVVRAEHEQTVLEDGDRLEIVTLVGGG